MSYPSLALAGVVALSSSVAVAGEYRMALPRKVAESPKVGRFVRAWNAALGGGCRLELNGKGVDIALERAQLPHSVRQAKRAARAFVGDLSPDTRQHGLMLPLGVENAGRVVILVHGLDCDGQNFLPLREVLQEDGYAVARFNYPDDQPIAESAGLFLRDLASFRERHPAVHVSVVGHSLGALVARDAIEGPDYPGGVDHFVMIAPPNHGSQWARFHFVSEVHEQFHLYRTDPRWRPSWTITDGLGEAAGDLTPGSGFLRRVNARPRREGVKYTIIAGTRFPAQSIAADALESVRLRAAASRVRNWSSRRDGPVSIASAKLAGVADFVSLPVDHTDLYYGYPPAAWPTIRDRLAR